MKKTITNFEKGFQFIKTLSLACLFLLFTVNVSAQYPAVAHNAAPCVDATISTVIIEDGSGTEIYKKEDFCNGSAATNFRTEFGDVCNPIVAMSPGSTYTIRVNTTSTGFDDSWSGVGVWADFNDDKDFDDAGEFLSDATWSDPLNGGTGTPNGINSTRPTATRSVTFTVPSSATNNYRLRIRSCDFGTAFAQANATGGLTDGETEDFFIGSKSLAAPTPGFAMPDSAFIGSLVNFTNLKPSYLSHKWTIDGMTYTTTNASHVFTTLGDHDVKLVSTNCLGTDSITKTVHIVTPDDPPLTDFVSNANVVELLNNINLYDLSSNGPTYWDWEFIKIVNGLPVDTVDGSNPLLTQLRGGSPYINKNPTVGTGEYGDIVGLGTWDVQLTTTNIEGSHTRRKVGYITVQKTSYNLGIETDFQINPNSIMSSSYGTLFDEGGATGDHGTGAARRHGLIAPCGAQSVTLDFSSFDFAAGANLIIYDGINFTGNRLSPVGGYTGNLGAFSVTSNTGVMYLYYTAGTNENDGFAATWSSVQGTPAAPISEFNVPASFPTLYNNVTVDFENTSQNIAGKTDFEWILSGPENGTFSTKDLLNQTFNTNGLYTLCLKTTTCDQSTSTVCKNFTVVSPSTPTNIDFTVDNQRPAVGETINFTATSDKANRWEWNIFSPVGVTPTVPATYLSKNASFTFSNPGTYTVQCRAYNSLDETATEASAVKTDYIIVVETCTPVVGLTTSSDVGISNFKLEDPVSATTVIDNATPAGVGSSGNGYSNFSSLGIYELNFGGTYNFEVQRSSNVNPMTRTIWIDWNVDGDFDDVGERVAWDTFANTDMTFSGSFVVPDRSSAFEAKTTMRIGVSLGSDLNLSCGANSHPEANRIGEFEDYIIKVVNDGNVPIISLNGNDTVYVEEISLPNLPNYVSDSGIVNDPSQGNITGNLVITSNFNQYLPGIYYEVYNATDASGNDAATVTRVVYVVSDQTPPTITINGSADTTIDVGSTWTDLGATANDNKEGNLTSAIITSSNVDVNLLGVYQVTYKIQDFQGNAASATRTVHVIDDELPVIVNARADKATSDPEWNVEVQLQSVFADITSASDNYNSLGNNLTLTANPTSPQGGAAVDTRFIGTTSVTYTAMDESGNKTTQIINYIIRDFIPPIIDLRTHDVINHRVNTPYSPVNPFVSDNLYSSTEISLTFQSNVDPFTVGTYEDVYTATDAAGNIATKTRTVNVIDDVKPIITGKDGGIIKLGVGSKANMIDYINFSDNYDHPSVMKANASTKFNNVNLQEAGLYSVVWTTTDSSGNVAKDFRLVVDVDYDHVVITNGVNDINHNDLMSIAPNPTSGKLNINVNLPDNEEINLGVFNTMGQQVVNIQHAKVNNGRYTTDLGHLTNGIYYVKMNLQGNIITKKVVLNK